jgi:transposase InsO family protein
MRMIVLPGVALAGGERGGCFGERPHSADDRLEPAVPTYIPTWQGWLYLATVIDCATRKIVGWAMGDNYRTPLITRAVKMAARNVNLPEGAVFHSDRGSNYTSAEFARELAALGIRQSVGRARLPRTPQEVMDEFLNGQEAA